MTIIVHLRNGTAIRMDSVIDGDGVLRRWHNPLRRRVEVKTINKHQLCCRKLAVIAIESVTSD